MRYISPGGLVSKCQACICSSDIRAEISGDTVKVKQFGNASRGTVTRVSYIFFRFFHSVYTCAGLLLAATWSSAVRLNIGLVFHEMCMFLHLLCFVPLNRTNQHSKRKRAYCARRGKLKQSEVKIAGRPQTWQIAQVVYFFRNTCFEDTMWNLLCCLDSLVFLCKGNECLKFSTAFCSYVFNSLIKLSKRAVFFRSLAPDFSVIVMVSIQSRTASWSPRKTSPRSHQRFGRGRGC